MYGEENIGAFKWRSKRFAPTQLKISRRRRRYDSNAPERSLSKFAFADFVEISADVDEAETPEYCRVSGCGRGNRPVSTRARL